MQATRFPAERLAQLYPGVDLGLAQERFLTQYRALTTGIAVLGLLLLGWLFSYMRRPDWDDGPVEVLVTVYFLAAQMLPLVLVVWIGVRFNKEHKRSLPEGKRTAILQRRGLFDFVSPFIVFLAVLSYFLFAAFVIYIQQHPFPGFAGLINHRRRHAGLRSECIRRVHGCCMAERAIRLRRTRVACTRSVWQ